MVLTPSECESPATCVAAHSHCSVAKRWSGLAPAITRTPCRVLRIDAADRLVGDENRTCVIESGLWFCAVFGECNDCLNTQRRHLGRELHNRCANNALLYIFDAGARTINRSNQDVVLLASGLDCRIGTGSSWLVDCVESVHLRRTLEQVFHRGLRLRLIAVRILHADDRRRIGSEAETLEESIVTECVHRAARGAVEHQHLGCGRSKTCLHPRTLSDPGCEII